MKVTIQTELIDITEIPLNNHINWDSLLDDLKAKPIPGKYSGHAKRMGVIGEGTPHVFIYRNADMPLDAEIIQILKQHGIE